MPSDEKTSALMAVISSSQLVPRDETTCYIYSPVQQSHVHPFKDSVMLVTVSSSVLSDEVITSLSCRMCEMFNIELQLKENPKWTSNALKESLCFRCSCQKHTYLWELNRPESQPVFPCGQMWTVVADVQCHLVVSGCVSCVWSDVHSCSQTVVQPPLQSVGGD